MSEDQGSDRPQAKIEMPKITKENLLKPDGLWVASIYRWIDGDPEGVCRMLMQGTEIPSFAREWLARALSGEVKKRRGAKKQYKPLAELIPDLIDPEVRSYFGVQLLREQFQGRSELGGTPKERAIATCAERFGLTEDQVSHIVYPRRNRGD